MPQKIVALKLANRSWDCVIVLDKHGYVNGGQLLHILDRLDGSVIARATVWIEGLAKDEVAIKNYSENEGLYPQLVAERIIYPHHRIVPSGFVTFPICRLHQDFLNSNNKGA